jgi:hypothetical protein
VGERLYFVFCDLSFMDVEGVFDDVGEVASQRRFARQLIELVPPLHVVQGGKEAVYQGGQM